MGMLWVNLTIDRVCVDLDGGLCLVTTLKDCVTPSVCLFVSVSPFFPPLIPGGADDNLIEGGEMKFVCKPGARNITVIFQPLLR